jgi:hypothetical protein
MSISNTHDLQFSLQVFLVRQNQMVINPDNLCNYLRIIPNKKKSEVFNNRVLGQ